MIKIKFSILRNYCKPIFYNVKRFIHISRLIEFCENHSILKSRIESKKYAQDFFEKIYADGETDFLHLIKILNGNLLQIGEHMNLKKSIRLAVSQELNISINHLNEIVDCKNNLYEKQFSDENLIESKIEISQIINCAEEILNHSGKNSQLYRFETLKEFFKLCKFNKEIKWLVRVFEGNLRIGLGQKMLVNILSDPLYSNIHFTIEKEVFGFSMKTNEIIVGVPVKCQLSKAILDKDEIENHLKQKRDSSNFILEYKYDGERTQIHYNKLENMLISFSRNNEPQTKKFENLLSKLHQELQNYGHIESFVIDGEIIGFDYENKIELNFQEFQNRIQKESFLLSKVIIFDILYFNGESLLSKELFERKQILKNNFELKFECAKNISYEEIQPNSDLKPILQRITDLLDLSINQGYEGLVLKIGNGASSIYKADNRSSWAKLKKGILGIYQDSFDLIVIGGYKGKGKRKEVFGAYLMAAMNKRTGEFESICKIGTGFTDEQLISMTQKLKPTLKSSKPENFIVSKTLKPDFWFDGKYIFEVGFESISSSPLYDAGKEFTDTQNGLSLRFPKFIRSRDDKSPSQSTTSEYVIPQLK